MAVVQYDTRFDWCNELISVKRNYSNNECFEIVKKGLSTFKGADQDFINHVRSLKNSSFQIRRLFFPVYYVDVKATYSWETREYEYNGYERITNNTETNTFTESFFKGIHDSCNPNTFVGRKDERFYELSHVADLDGDIYNESCCYTSCDLKSELNSCVASKKPYEDADWYINNWGVSVIFVPMLAVFYEYKGKSYQAIVNMHNGSWHVEYKPSQETKENSKKMWNKSIILRSTSLSIAAIVLILSLWKGFWAIVFSAIFFIILCVTARLGHNKAYFLNLYSLQGEDLGKSVIKAEIIHLIISIIISLFMLIIFFK